MVIIIAGSTYIRADTGICEGASITLPFTDVSSGSVFFCSIAEAYFSALTNGTSPTTYSPSANVTREQMAAFITRTMDQSLTRGSRRAALDHFWNANALAGGPLVGASPRLVKSDGADLWVAIFGDNAVARVRASDGKLLGTWTGATNAYGVLVVGSDVFVTGRTNPGSLYRIDPSAAPGAVTPFSFTLGANPAGIAYDGNNIWTANVGTGVGTGSVSRVSLSGDPTFTVSTDFSQPIGILYDGASLWVTDTGDGTLKKLDSSFGVIQTVIVGANPQFPVFDGTNIWVPNIGDNTVTVVRASTGVVLATLSGNGLDSPRSAAFDGERILVTSSVFSVSMWKATDLSPLGSFSLGGSESPFGACSDGLNFWITQTGNGRLVRF
jgi:hypothetical protein